MTTRADLQEALDQVVDFDGDRAKTYRSLLDLAGRILDMVEVDVRELTVWEKANLRLALGSLLMGKLRLAWTDLDLALAEPEDLAPDTVPSKEAAEKLAEFRITDYRRALKYLIGIAPWR